MKKEYMDNKFISKATVKRRCIKICFEQKEERKLWNIGFWVIAAYEKKKENYISMNSFWQIWAKKAKIK